MFPIMKAVNENAPREELADVRYVLQVNEQRGKHIPTVWYAENGVQFDDYGPYVMNNGRRIDLKFEIFKYYSIGFFDNSTNFILSE